jgi:hypothetical protein
VTRTAEIFGPVDRGDSPEDAHEHSVAAAVERERVKRDARRRLDAEERRAVAPPVIETLRVRLARPRRPTPWRIEHWQPQGSRVMLAAQFKAGKTTLVGNLIRSLVDGDPFLGRDTVTPIDGSLWQFDFEMGEPQLDDWMCRQSIQSDDRVVVVPMRGRATAFDIINAAVRAEWARRLRLHRASYVIADCVRPIMDALGLDEHRDAGRLLVAFDALLAEAGISEGLLVHHMGHNGERSRGDSRLRDWPDVEWRLVRKDDEPASPRFITAYGRDVDVPESQIEFSPRTRRLTSTGGSRKGAEACEALDAIMDVLPDLSSPSAHAIWGALREKGIPRATVESALRLGKQSGRLSVEKGPKNSNLYSCSPVSQSSPAVSREAGELQFPSSPPLYKGGKLGNSPVPGGTNGDGYSF